jgi:DNA-binding protein HU-beta
MNKNELVESVVTATGLTKADAGRAVNAVFETITSTLQKGDDVALVGFGTFTVKLRPARTGRNPANGEPINIAAAKVPSFKAGKGLKDAVN